MYRIAVMGDKMSIFGFAALGMKTVECEDGEKAKKELAALVKSGCGIIYITESLAALIPDEIEKYRFSMTPAVILIPGGGRNTGKGMADVYQSVEKAVGSKII